MKHFTTPTNHAPVTPMLAFSPSFGAGARRSIKWGAEQRHVGWMTLNGLSWYVDITGVSPVYLGGPGADYDADVLPAIEAMCTERFGL